jgi:hypothetical protein
MKKTVYACLALIVAAVFINCEDEFGIRNTGEAKIVLEPEGAGYSLYFPYVAGKTWEYESQTTMTEDFPEGYPGGVDTTITDTSFSFDKVLCETELLGDTKIPVWKTWEGAFPLETLYVHIGEEYADFYRGIYHSHPWYSTLAVPEVGDSWENDFGNDYIYKYKVVADGVEANGYEDCLRIEVTPPGGTAGYDTYQHFQYWAPDVGRVQTTVHSMITIDFAPYGDYVCTYDEITNLTNEPAGIQE